MAIYTRLITLLFCLTSPPAAAAEHAMATDDRALAAADLFDHIDDFLNFPCDDVIDDFSDDTVANAVAGFSALADPLGGNGGGDGFFGVGAVSGHEETAKLGSLEELDIGSGDADWVSHFLDDTADFSLDLPTIPSTVTAKNNGSSSSNNNNNSKDDSPFRTSSPVSVLEHNSLNNGGGNSSSPTTATSSSSSSSSSSFGFARGGSSNVISSNPMVPICPPEAAVVIPGRARTKRPRPASFSPRTLVTVPFVPPSSEPAAPLQSDPESFGEYDPSPMMMMMMMTTKKKKKKKSAPVAAVADEESSLPPVRKCMHCQITKTPQWRAGPMGPKTLCNACGVRYKSGRLFPEYRPAASPTFVPSIHSNSHKKVVEMRIKATQQPGMPVPDNPAAKGCDLLQFIRRKD